MDEILKQFDKMTSFKQTDAICQLIKEGGKFLCLDDILDALVRIYGHDVSEKAESIEQDLAY